MSNDKELNNSNRRTGQSQDAVRHEKDALHHKFHKGPQPGSADEGNDQQIDGQQPEIPKVGSRDAPGG
jgi:hypothetical protein